MCLNNITKRYDPADPKVRTGWKYVLRNEFGHIESLYMRVVFPEGEWMQTFQNYSDVIKCHNDGMRNDKYDAGFHVFPTREEARKAKRILLSDSNEGGIFQRAVKDIVLVKVEVKDVVYEGTDATTTIPKYLNANIKTLVAKQMRILEVIKKG